MIPVPPPWVLLALVFTVGNYVQDVGEIFILTASASLGRQGSGCALCHKTTGLLLKVTELDEVDDIDCSKLCFGSSRCRDICGSIIKVLGTSESYPCVAAGLCPVEDEDTNIVCKFDWRTQRCFPVTACQRKFPARCVINAGLQRWRRQVNVLGKHAGLMASALANQPRCGSADAGPYCVHAPQWIGSKVCEVLAWVVPFCFGTLASIRAVETPGGDDDRQWLTFWICFFAFSALERAFALLTSWVPVYYEAKLLLLCWLMFRHGADSIYRGLRRALTHSPRLVPFRVRGGMLRSVSTVASHTLSRLAMGTHRTFERTAYFRRLPAEIRAAWMIGAGKRAARSVADWDRFLQETLTSERLVMQTYGSRCLVALRLLWDANAHPRFLQVTLVCAQGLPLVSGTGPSPGSGGASGPAGASPGSGRASGPAGASGLGGPRLCDAYCILSVVPPAASARLDSREAERLEALRTQAMRSGSGSGSSSGVRRRHTMGGLSELLSPTAAQEKMGSIPEGSLEEHPDHARPGSPRTPPASLWGPALAAKALADRSAERGPKQPARCYGHVVSQVRRQSPFPQWRQSFEFELHGGGINDVRED
jgi:hypothetical protein